MRDEFLRYSCQIALPRFNESTQLLLQNAKVLVIGAGGLGCPAAQYLAAAGVGTLGIADDDVISISNLHRQVLYGPADEGQKKAVLACERLKKQNPGIKLIAHDVRVTSQNIFELIAPYDILVDGTDNFDTRYLINDAAVIKGKPVVYGAIYQYEGHVAVWNLINERGDKSPNYRDIFPKVDASKIPNCTEGGVIPTLAGIIGCMQANEVIKYITKTGDILAGKILIFDAQTMQSRIIKIGDVSQTSINRLVETVINPTISADEVKKLMSEDAVNLIDVREEEEHEDFDIGGELIPLDELNENLDKINTSKKIVFYCSSGKRSAEAVKIVKKKFPDAEVYTLAGGLGKW